MTMGLAIGLLMVAGIARAEAGDADVGGAQPDVLEEDFAAAPDDVWDPWEGFNRKMFWFNQKLDLFVLEPASRGWNWVLPNPVQRAIRRSLLNFREPWVMTNDVLQGKIVAGGNDLARFLTNTTVGVAGLFDPASRWLGLEPNDEDFGQTLGVWGLGPGPYLVMPLIGSLNIRDGVGYGVDTTARVWPFFAPFFVSAAVATVETVNNRSLILDDVDEARKASLDFYVGVRNAYGQRRRQLIADSNEVSVDDAESLYFYTD
jgi:phospholipid-binding lipoprotein MlaA